MDPFYNLFCRPASQLAPVAFHCRKSRVAICGFLQIIKSADRNISGNFITLCFQSHHKLNRIPVITANHCRRLHIHISELFIDIFLVRICAVYVFPNSTILLLVGSVMIYECIPIALPAFIVAFTGIDVSQKTNTFMSVPNQSSGNIIDCMIIINHQCIRKQIVDINIPKGIDKNSRNMKPHQFLCKISGTNSYKYDTGNIAWRKSIRYFQRFLLFLIQKA